MKHTLNGLKNWTKHAWEPRKHFHKSSKTTALKSVLMREEDAISPVIATILLIAITVAIIGGLYVLVGHFTSSTKAPLSATLQEQSEGTISATMVLTYSTPSNMSTLADIGMTLASASSTPTYYSFGNLQSNSSAIWALSNTGNFNVTIVNPHGSSSYIESGAIVIIQYTGSQTSYSFSGETFTLSYKGYSGEASVTLP